jgi:acyl carrier protein
MNNNASPNIIHSTIKTDSLKIANYNKLEQNKDGTITWSKTQSFDLLINEVDNFQDFCYQICQFGIQTFETEFVCSNNIQQYTKIVTILKDIVKLIREIKITVQYNRLLKLEISEMLRNTMSSCLNIDLEQVALTANFVNDLGIDSLDWQKLLITLEDLFTIRITDEVTETLATVQQLIECVISTVEVEKVALQRSEICQEAR